LVRPSKFALSIFAAASAALLAATLSLQADGVSARTGTTVTQPDPASFEREIRLRLAQQSPAAPAPTQPSATQAAPQQAIVGIYPTTLYEIDIGTSTFKASFYVWFRWTGDVDPTPTMELINAVDDTTTTKLFDAPQIQKDGSRYQIFRVSGRFFQPFSLKKFPLDVQQLSITIEDTTHPAKDLLYIPDNRDSGLSDRISIPGWDVGRWALTTGTHVYNTDFGEIGSDNSDYATATFQLSITRPFSYFLWKLLLPLCIVLAANWAALLLHPSLVDVRTALPATALLTAVFLQQSYSASLPDVGYLVLLDKIYVLAYALIIVTLTLIIASTVRNPNPEPNGADVSTKPDLITLALQIVAFAIGTGLLLATR
jgi:hypothetical protein